VEGEEGGEVDQVMDYGTKEEGNWVKEKGMVTGFSFKK